VSVSSLVALGLDHAHGFALDEQHVVCRACIGGVFTHRHANAGTKVQLFGVLDDPTRRLKFLVDEQTRSGFRRHGFPSRFASRPPQLYGSRLQVAIAA